MLFSEVDELFGYINVFKDELKIKDYDTYRAYYCGLCKKLGKNHNQFMRLSLNYDLTFLALLLDSLSDEKNEFSMEGCIKKVGKRKVVTKAQGIDFAADMNILLSYYKLKDDINDTKSFKALIASVPFMHCAKQISFKYPDLKDEIELRLKRLSFLETMSCDIIDKAANEFALIMQSIFKTADKKLDKFGYQLGRLIYIMDAYDDINEDYDAGNYNPAVLQYGYNGTFTEEIIQNMKDNLYFSMSELSTSYETLNVVKNKVILDNIIYLGIRARCDLIINERNIKNEKPL